MELQHTFDTQGYFHIRKCGTKRKKRCVGYGDKLEICICDTDNCNKDNQCDCSSTPTTQATTTTSSSSSNKCIDIVALFLLMSAFAFVQYKIN